MDNQDRRDIMRLRSLFWAKFYDVITLAEMQAEVRIISGRQPNLFA